MKALTVTQVILWDDGQYSAVTTATDTDAVPIASSQSASRKDAEGIKQELLEMKAAIERWNERKEEQENRQGAVNAP